MQYVGLIERAAVVGSLALISAFMLTLWPGKRRLTVAAVLYGVGVLASMAPSIYHGFLLVRISYGLTDSDPNPIALVWLIWPLWAVSYPVAAAALLWPSIPQEKALRWGKFLHIAIGLPPMLIQILSTSPVYAKAFGLSWVAYTVVWFCIRENHRGFLRS